MCWGGDGIVEAQSEEEDIGEKVSYGDKEGI
jgi:hypothetical protein